MVTVPEVSDMLRALDLAAETHATQCMAHLEEVVTEGLRAAGFEVPPPHDVEGRNQLAIRTQRLGYQWVITTMPDGRAEGAFWGPEGVVPGAPRVSYPHGWPPVPYLAR